MSICAQLVCDIFSFVKIKPVLNLGLYSNFPYYASIFLVALVYYYYSNNFAGKIDASLVTSLIAWVASYVTSLSF